MADTTPEERLCLHIKVKTNKSPAELEALFTGATLAGLIVEKAECLPVHDFSDDSDSDEISMLGSSPFLTTPNSHT